MGGSWQDGVFTGFLLALSSTAIVLKLLADRRESSGRRGQLALALLIAQDPSMRTVQVVLSQFMTSQGVRYPEMFTGALIATVPALVVFLFLQRWLVQGVERSGLK